MYPTLFVGIDVSKASNQVYAMTFDQKKLLSTSIPNTQDGVEIMERKLLDLLDKNALSKITIVLESTGVYSAHIATFLSASKYLAVFDVKVYIINPKISRNYRKSFSDIDKTDPKDAYILVDIARVDRLSGLKPFKGSQRVALERLTRHRQHISELFIH